MSAHEWRSLAELGLLAVLAGVLGPWIVLRRLSFFTHATGTATFPGLVVAGPWGIAAPIAALGSAVVFALGLAGLTRTRQTGGRARRRGGRAGVVSGGGGAGVASRRAAGGGPRLDTGAATGVLLVAMLAVGTILASDVYESGAGVDALLVGSLVAVTGSDVALTVVVVLGVLLADGALRRTWAASTFDPDGAAALGVGSRAADLALLLAIGAAAVVAVDAVGALLAGVVLVVPAATVRLMTDDLDALRLGAGILAAAEGSAALHLANRLDIGAGPALALLGGVVFAVVSAVAARVRPGVAA